MWISIIKIWYLKSKLARNIYITRFKKYFLVALLKATRISVLVISGLLVYYLPPKSFPIMGTFASGLVLLALVALVALLFIAPPPADVALVIADWALLGLVALPPPIAVGDLVAFVLLAILVILPPVLLVGCACAAIEAKISPKASTTIVTSIFLVFSIAHRV